MYPKSSFVNGSNRPLLKPIFWELNTEENKKGALYTLKDEEHHGLPSLYQLYMEMEDITEFEFANKYLLNYSHWLELSETSWFKPYVEKFRRDLELKLKARHLNRTKAIAYSNAKESFQALKYLLDKGWEKPAQGETKRGRPSKDEIHKEAVRQLEVSRQLDDDFIRITNIN